MSASILTKTETAAVHLLRKIRESSPLLEACAVGPGHSADTMSFPMLVADVKQVRRPEFQTPIFQCDLELYVITQIDDETEAVHDERVEFIIACLENADQVKFEINGAEDRPVQNYRLNGFEMGDYQTARVERRFITSIRLTWDCA